MPNPEISNSHQVPTLGTEEDPQLQLDNLIDNLEQQIATLKAQLAQTTAERNEALHLAATDFLTGLYNRRFFAERLRAELNRARRDQSTLALVMLDLDYLKTINDKFGHLQGDKALGQLAGVLRKTIREYDTAARYGGDEFAVSCPGTSRPPAIEITSRLYKAVADHPFTTSIGITAARVEPQLDLDIAANKLIRQADVALYAVKNAGRNAIGVYLEKDKETGNDLVAVFRPLEKQITVACFRVSQALNIFEKIGEVSIDNSIQGWQAISPIADDKPLVFA